MYASIIPRLAAVAAAVATASAVPDVMLYGLELMHNSPAQSTLIGVNQTTGAVSVIGPQQGYPGLLDATGDLAAVDTQRNLLYYLGDSVNGTTMVGLDLTSGQVRCTANIPIQELGFVGFGQSLNFDVGRDELIVSGIVVNSTTNVSSHILFTGPAGPSGPGGSVCGPFSHVGTFGDAAYMPMLHASAYDESRQVLYVGLASASQSFVVGIIDVAAGTMNRTDPQDPNNEHMLIGMKWDPNSKTLVGLESTPDYTGLLLVQLEPWAGQWTVRPVQTAYPVVQGNAGEVSAFDASSGQLYGVLAPTTTSQQLFLARIDVASAAVQSTAPLQAVGLGLLNNLVYPNES